MINGSSINPLIEHIASVVPHGLSLRFMSYFCSTYNTSTPSYLFPNISLNKYSVFLFVMNMILLNLFFSACLTEYSINDSPLGPMDAICLTFPPNLEDIPATKYTRTTIVIYYFISDFNTKN